MPILVRERVAVAPPGPDGASINHFLMGALPDLVAVNERLVSGRRDERLNVVFWVVGTQPFSRAPEF